MKKNPGYINLVNATNIFSLLVLFVIILTHIMLLLNKFSVEKSALVSWGIGLTIYGVWGLKHKIYTKKYSAEVITGPTAVMWGNALVILGLFLVGIGVIW